MVTMAYAWWYAWWYWTIPHIDTLMLRCTLQARGSGKVA